MIVKKEVMLYSDKNIYIKDTDILHLQQYC